MDGFYFVVIGFAGFRSGIRESGSGSGSDTGVSAVFRGGPVNAVFLDTADLLPAELRIAVIFTLGGYIRLRKIASAGIGITAQGPDILSARLDFVVVFLAGFGRNVCVGGVGGAANAGVASVFAA